MGNVGFGLFAIVSNFYAFADERPTSKLVWGISLGLVLAWVGNIAWLIWIQAEQLLYFFSRFLSASLALSLPALLLLTLAASNQLNKAAENYEPAVSYAALFCSCLFFLYQTWDSNCVSKQVSFSS